MVNTAKGSPMVMSEYVMDHLDTSFKVVLVNSVKRIVDNKGHVDICIPDYQGLIKKIALVRASNARKLASNDIRFLRKTLELSSKDLASKLDISPEHLSRCEGGERTLSANSEKMLRLIVLAEPLMVFTKALEVGGDSGKEIPSLLPLLADIRDIISDMKIDSVHDVEQTLTFRFVHKRHDGNGAGIAANEDSDEGEWAAPEKMAA